MIKPRSSVEGGGSQPEREEVEPDSLEFIVQFLQELGPNGVNAIENLKLVARDARLAAKFDSALLPLLERADQIDQVREALTALFEQATDKASAAVLHGIGETALHHIPEQQTK